MESSPERPDVRFSGRQKWGLFLILACIFAFSTGGQRSGILGAIGYGIGGASIPFVIGYWIGKLLAPNYKTVWALIGATILTLVMTIMVMVTAR